MVEQISEVSETSDLPAVNLYAIAWWSGRLRHYQKMQVGFCDRAHQAALSGDTNPAIQKMRRLEITRLQGFCAECHAKLEELKSGS